jgi:SAM-dependent methyltransferase
MVNPHDGLVIPSPWIARWAPLVATGGRVLDVACGSGRHARFFAGRGHPVTAVDRDAAAVGRLAGTSGVEARIADLEATPWPFGHAEFDAVVVTNYLSRPLFPHLCGALRPGGLLIYETFMLGNERFGRPSNPDFLLAPGELLELIAGALTPVAFEQGVVSTPKPAAIQRLCAARAAPEAVFLA